ncbi:MAG TPA: sigma 54-interacting transcriptional regulator, partial [Candidatus Babeliales bacterium]|nr:sigma 54-interacting transcriptional regulator [Candidatus Babeliales bacterium]
KIHNWILLIITGTLVSGFLYLIIFNGGQIHPRPAYEFTLLDYTARYLLVIMLPTVFLVLYSIYKQKIPKILKQQIKTLFIGLIAPRIIADYVQTYTSKLVPEYVMSNYFAVSISSISVAYAALYCTNKILKLRFLNLNSHVQAGGHKFNFINDFRTILEQLSHATTTRELTNTVKDFFQKALQIPTGLTLVFFRQLNHNPSLSTQARERMLLRAPSSEPDVLKSALVESFINSSTEVQKHLFEKRILIYDEIEFSNFYDDNQVRQTVLTFMQQVHAEIFIPIYQDHSISAYILIERDAKRKGLYSDLERDEMIVFASYLENTINLLQKQDLDTIILREKELQEELFLKHQEINQYKESIRSFLKKSQKNIGILFYKNRNFVFANQYAKEIIKINPNVQDSHPLAQKLRALARQVIEYKSAQTGFATDPDGQKLIISAVPNLEYNNVIITVYYPDISDIVKQQIDHLNDPSRWDYLLYLETTESGKLINQLIPGTGESLLNYKISLLQIALSKKAILLSLPEDDLINTVEIINHISLRKNLYILDLQNRLNNFDVAIKLFGINPIFGKTIDAPPLLQSLHNGTLFIKNIHLLDLETQNYLAEFIRYGFYHQFKGDQKSSSDVRVICSTNHNLKELVKEQKFSAELYQALKETTLTMPSLLTLPEPELDLLAHDLGEQILENSKLKNFLSLTDKDRKKLVSRQMVSISEFKLKIQRLIAEKSKEHNLKPATVIDPIFNTADPALIEAAKLGKHALKDPAVMALLWDKFKNQNKIAEFLGVNRSSVHRRCKDYNLV